MASLPAPVDEHATWLSEQVALVETPEGFPSANSLVVTDREETVLVDEVGVFYGDHVDTNPATRYWCRVMTGKHLERLAQQGRAEERADGWVRLDG